MDRDKSRAQSAAQSRARSKAASRGSSKASNRKGGKNNRVSPSQLSNKGSGLGLEESGWENQTKNFLRMCIQDVPNPLLSSSLTTNPKVCLVNLAILPVKLRNLKTNNEKNTNPAFLKIFVFLIRKNYKKCVFNWFKISRKISNNFMKKKQTKKDSAQVCVTRLFKWTIQ